MLDTEGSCPHRRADGDTNSDRLAGANVHEVEAICYYFEHAEFRSDTRRVMTDHAKRVFAGDVVRHQELTGPFQN
jgi:hypothetical protein